MIKSASKLELHYHFLGNSHSMNAIIRNDCEKEILLIFKEIITTLDFKINIESEPLSEGGLIEYWKLLGVNNTQLALVIALITIILSRIPVENKELVDLQIKNLKLDNELKTMELRKIKNELVKNEDISDELVERIIDKLESEYKIVWHKSNFYKKMYSYPKIDKISIVPRNDKNLPTDKSRTINRTDFLNFFVHSDSFPSRIDEYALIDIISPVLITGSFNWKGIYNGQVISFEMKDGKFKNSVLNKEIEFANGTAIRCVLQQNRRINEIGVVQIVGNQVLVVLEVIEGRIIVNTDQGKKYLKEKIHLDSQLKIAFG